MTAPPDWVDYDLPTVLRDFAQGRGPYLELVLHMAADEIEKLRDELMNRGNHE